MITMIIYGMAGILQMIVFGMYLRETAGLRRPLYWIAVCWLVLETAEILIGKLTDSALINGAADMILLTAATVFLCHGARLKKILAAAAYMSTFNLLVILSHGFADVFHIADLHGYYASSLAEAVLLVLPNVIAVTLLQTALCIWKQHVRQKYPVQNWIGILFVSYGCMALSWMLLTDILIRDVCSPYQAMMLVLLLIIHMAGYYFYCIVAEKNRMDTEMRIYQKQMSVYREWHEGISRSRNELRSFQHDINNHLGVLMDLCREGGKPAAQLEEIRLYLSTIGTEYHESLQDADSGNLLLDSVVNMKKEYARSNGIEMETELYIPEKMQLNSMDVVILLGNLLDNAMEACVYCGGEMPVIRLGLRYVMSNLVLTVENTCDGSLDGQSGGTKDGRLPATSKNEKKRHGIGMQNICRIVEKYNGELLWNAGGGMFSVSVFLYGFADQRMDRE